MINLRSLATALGIFFAPPFDRFEKIFDGPRSPEVTPNKRRDTGTAAIKRAARKRRQYLRQMGRLK